MTASSEQRVVLDYSVESDLDCLTQIDVLLRSAPNVAKLSLEKVYDQQCRVLFEKLHVQRQMLSSVMVPGPLSPEALGKDKPQ